MKIIATIGLATLFPIAIHNDLPEAGACIVIFLMFTINLK